MINIKIINIIDLEQKMYISEEKIIEVIKKTLNERNIKLKYDSNIYYKRLKVLYLKGHIDIQELDVYKQGIKKNKFNSSITDNLEYLKISNSNDLQFKINKEEYKVAI